MVESILQTSVMKFVIDGCQVPWSQSTICNEKKIQQVNLSESPAKVVLTCRKLQYHSNLHEITQKTKFD